MDLEEFQIALSIACRGLRVARKGVATEICCRVRLPTRSLSRSRAVGPCMLWANGWPKLRRCLD